ncbi:SLIT and NTRK-like protein 4 [Diprion similis]|uniref:SLIT and NTRK-like protein 4 n=1 Tax=Diprion similis TaxID=362088 RepID=UPI001EF939FB|nr:SLIT and NTRK-like protein 4 [Diprion similis]
MRNVLLLLVTLVTSTLANFCSSNGPGRSMFVCRNASLANLAEVPRYTYRIKFFNSNIRNIPENTFTEFHQLKSLSFVNCSVNDIEGFAFRSLLNLKVLNLSRNALTTIGTNVFSGLKRLEKLDLTNNMIQSIEEGSFTNVSNIGLLDLRYNDLTRIDVAILRPLTAASTLDLRFNKLRCVSSSVFNVTKVKWIYIGDNPWNKTCWSDLTQSLYNFGIYYGRNLAFDSLTEDRLSWKASDRNGREFLSKELAEEQANIVKEAEGWKKFYESVVQELADEQQRLEDIAMAAKYSEETLSQETNDEKDSDSGWLQYGRDFIVWILGVCKIIPFI